VEAALAGKKPSPKALEEAARLVADGEDALADIHASAEYRKEMAAVYTRRALTQAIARATGRKA
jgi:CO/xanthine dehydrogenase FAD-binding subunit